ncbi:family 43 glycosylhydrolase [Pedobacter sp.]|uniref:family 43 glycosylhydrolase n=1 Tax=Pedobacter sp. TaxID=1411316 RepID=UPI003D7F7335
MFASNAQRLLFLMAGLLLLGTATPLNAQKSKKSAYLFTYFTGNGKYREAIRFAISYDGYNYKALNNNNPVLDVEKTSFTGGVRDPHILRGEDGKTFYMVATDMQVAKYGWGPNHGLVMMKSTDLINWDTHLVNINITFPAFENSNRVWAPQTIYDPVAKKYMLYWSMRFGNGPDIIYYSFANKDFTALETEPKQLFFSPDHLSCIDGDIIFKDGKYHLFYKTEGSGKGIKKAVSSSLTEGYVPQDKYLQQTTDPVEGAGIFKLSGTNKYILMYDLYTKGRYQFTESTDLENFKVIDQQVSMDFLPRHGTIMAITPKEAKVLVNYWDKARMATVELSPAERPKNPILNGYYADPEILYAQKTGQYYLYPTSDGVVGWGSTSFKSFSSKDLVNWKDEGVILDLPKDVSWAQKHAWAPTAIEKKINGAYKYFYYYTAAQKIGVAVADHPAGPFKDSGKALVAEKPAGIKGGQEIDPDVFTDPQTGKSYLYWGNGYIAGVELNEDMVSFDQSKLKIITPDRTFREGTEVFYRNGIYYFLWSEGDTRSEDYRVRYGTSTSPLGKITVKENNLILSKDTAQGIYGTGHNSVIQIPGKDEWYIIYHRFSYPNGQKVGRAAGFYREVCMDKLTFNADGSIQIVKPTLEGANTSEKSH